MVRLRFVQDRRRVHYLAMNSTRLYQVLFGIVSVIVSSGCDQAVLTSSSMQPTIAPGEKLIVNHLAYELADPKRWDVVAFMAPDDTNQTWVLRVVALPGESVAFASGGITIDEKPLKIPPNLTNVNYVGLDHPNLRYASVRISSPYTVPTDCFFLLGDSSTNANDSRMWGAVPRKNIIGKIRGK